MDQDNCENNLEESTASAAPTAPGAATAGAAAGSTSSTTKQKHNNPNINKKHFHQKDYSMKKRPTSKSYQRKNDIYITNKSDFKAQIKQCDEILNSNFDEIYLHCMGNAITRGINLALTLVQESQNGLGYEANTSTIELIDDFHPLKDDDDFTVQKRYNSCLHIKIYKQSSLLLLKKQQ